MKQSLFILLFMPMVLWAVVSVAPNDADILITGSPYSKIGDTMVVFQRHSDSLLDLGEWKGKFNPVRARTATGVIVHFKTAAPEVTAHFRMLPGDNRWGAFAIFAGDTLLKTVSFNPTKDSTITFTFAPPAGAESARYRITMPNWGTVAFKGLTLPDGASLQTLSENKQPQYIAYGNSITHGSGQQGTHQTYPFLVADHFGWELSSVAVGGAKTSLPIAEMLRDGFDTIDYMTVLIGYNDYNGEGIDTTEYSSRLRSVLSAVREKHTETKIFCITPTYSTTTIAEKTGIPLEDFRRVVRSAVADRESEGDSHIYLIEGKDLTTADDIGDAVHLNIEGAARFADGLITTIDELLTETAIEQQVITSSNKSTVYKYNRTLFLSGAKSLKLYSVSGRLLLESFSGVLDCSAIAKGNYLVEGVVGQQLIREVVVIR